jgi:hypothetical protein
MLEATDQVGEMRPRLDRLAVLARELLPSMLDEASGLFVQKIVWRADGAETSTATNALYSAMSVIGIAHDRDRQAEGVSVGRTLDALVGLAARKGSPAGLLGATLWALAVSRDERTGSFLQRCEERVNAPRASSMELGLVLSGLAAVIEAFPHLRQASTRVAEPAVGELLGRFSGSAGLFFGSAGTLRTRHVLHRRFTSFASQVYPLHGLARFSQATEASPPPQVRRAADRLVEARGPYGQWWWVYSSKTGAVVEAYPVYSVHQHAMAFMALAPLQILGVGSYGAGLAQGLEWMFGANELGTPLVDFERTAIARCIQRRGGDADGFLGMSRSQRRRTLLASWGLRSPADHTAGGNELEILHECRPYELGWLLYARSLVEDL